MAASGQFNTTATLPPRKKAAVLTG